MTTPNPRRVTTFHPGWLHDQVAKCVASLDSLPPKLRASLEMPTTRRRHHMPTTYPPSAAERQAQRDRYRDEAVARAEQEAGRVGHSLKCGGVLPGGRRHAGQPDGCANDGSGCLCVCHDPKETS